VQASMAFENATFTEEDFNIYISELQGLKNSSLKAVIEKVEATELSRLSDQQKLSTIDVVFSAYLDQSKVEKAIELNELLQQISKRLNQDETKVRYLINSFMIYFTQGKLDLAFESIIQAKDLARSTDVQKLEAEILLSLGNYYRRSDNFIEAESHYSQALIVVNNDTLRARILNNLGGANSRLGKFGAAINYMHDALEIHVRNNNLNEISNVYYSIAQANFNMQDFDMALQNYIESNRIDKELGNKNNQAYSATNICNLYGWFEEFDKAEQKCDEARHIFSEQNSKSAMVWLNNSIGQSYFKQKRFIELRDLMSESIDKYSKFTSPYTLQTARTLFVKALIGLKEFKEAEPIALEILRVADENSYANFSENILLVLSNIYQGLKEYETSLEYSQKYIKMSRESRKKVEDKRVKNHKNSIEYITKERDVERLSHQTTIAKKALELKNEQLKLWGSITLIIIISVLFFSYIILQKRKLSLKEKELLDEIIQKKNQLLADVSHELRTPLTVLKMQIQSLEFNLENDKEQAYQALHRRIGEINRLIADIYELSRADAGDLALTIESVAPITLLTSWCSDTQESFELVDGLDFKYHLELSTDVSVNIDQARFIQVLTNLVSNSRRYTHTPGKVVFTARIIEQQLVLLMEDSSPGVEPEVFSRIFERLYRVDQSRSREHGGSGLGLAICKSLIEAQGGKISAKASSLGGLTIEIHFPTI